MHIKEVFLIWQILNFIIYYLIVLIIQFYLKGIQQISVLHHNFC